MGFSDTPLCSYCNEDNETIKHLFYDCKLTQNLWSQIKNFFQNILYIPDLDLQSAVVGFLNENNNNNILLNNILVTFKMTLYKNREKHSATINNIIKNIVSRKKIEEAVALENNRLAFHQQKWGPLLKIT